MAKTQIITYRYRVKDKHASALRRMASDVNFVWNYANNAQKHALKWNRQWLSGFSLTYLVSGSSPFFNLQQHTIYKVVQQYAQSRIQHKKPYLRYRGKKSLGWIPFKAAQIKVLPKGIRCAGKLYSIWQSRQIPYYGKIKDGGSFSQDALGCWYLNIPVEVPCVESGDIQNSVGIDLGLKNLAALSNGENIVAPRIFRQSEARLAVSQRAGHKRRTKKIHAKIANQRKDFLHKVSTDIVKRFDHVIVGNVNAKALAKTKMAKSVLDAGWSRLRFNLRYKSIRNGGRFDEVNEAYSSQACSDCGAISGPKGRKGLSVREWMCNSCGSVHNRDHNSALFILRVGTDMRVTGAA